MTQFVKLLTATPTQVLSLIIESERSVLQAQLAGLGKEDDSEACFIQGALDDLKVMVLSRDSYKVFRWGGGGGGGFVRPKKKKKGGGGGVERYFSILGGGRLNKY